MINKPKFSIPKNNLLNLRLAFCYFFRLFEQDEHMLNSYNDQGQQEQTQVIEYCLFTNVWSLAVMAANSDTPKSDENLNLYFAKYRT